MSDIGKDYLILCFLGALGVLQIAASYGRLHGVLLLRGRLASAVLGFGFVAAGFLWFFLPGPRLTSDTVGGLDGNQQSLLFALCAGAALVTTLALSSVVNHRRLRGNSPAPGLDGLRTNTYVQALAHAVKQWKRRSWRRTPPSPSRSTTG